MDLSTWVSCAADPPEKAGHLENPFILFKQDISYHL
jgi:hypothetical protein